MKIFLTAIGWLWAFQLLAQVHPQKPVPLNYQAAAQTNQMVAEHSEQPRSLLNTQTALSGVQENTQLYKGKARQPYHQARLQQLLLGGLLMVLFFLGYLYFRKRQNTHKLAQLNRLIQEKHNQELVQHQHHWANEHQALKKQLRLKNQQLMAHHLHLSQKNQALKKIQIMVNQACQQTKWRDAKKRLEKLSDLVNYGLKMDKSWEGFHEVFEQLHNDFYKNLKLQYPALSQNDLLFCALIRLNLESKDIAEVLGITQASLKIKRNRLRQKMGLNASVDLYPLLLKFDSEMLV